MSLCQVRALLVVALVGVAGCELVADFDRDKIPSEQPVDRRDGGPDRSDAGDRPDAADDMDSGVDLDANLDADVDDAALPFEDAAQDADTDAAFHDAGGMDAGPDAADDDAG